MSHISAFVTQYYEWLIGVSLVLFIAALILVPALIVRIPADYFCHRHRQPVMVQHPLIRIVVAVLKNSLGAILALSGIIMLVTPGQGLITLLVGLMIMNYPGKYALERRLITRLHLLTPLNWLRRRYHVAPLEPPPSSKQPPDSAS